MNIIGHKKIINLLERIIQKDKISHAYLFYGPEKTGKYTAALQFANMITENHGEYNADLLIIAPEIEEDKGITRKKNITVEGIRELGRWLSLSPHGKRKVAIIDEADHLNAIAQNALLKTLEETSSGNVVILVSQNEKKLLPTVLSRCQKMRFAPVGAREMLSWIKKNKQEHNWEDDMLFWSLGRPGIMIDLSRDPSLRETRLEAMEEFRGLVAGNLHDRFSWAEHASKDIPLVTRKLNLWIVMLRACLLGKKQLVSLPRTKSLRGIIEIEKSLRILGETNSQARLVLENLLLTF